MNPAAFPELPGIDIEAGLGTVRGNAKLYRRLLLKFRESKAGYEEQIQVALSNLDSDALLRIAHTLKGVAGNLGMKELQQAALLLETACRERNTIDKEVLGDVLGKLQVVVDGLADMAAD